jgi:NAD(P)-dependent dehydrogenase (short-subunit alcohol dehydrogenase family)
MQRLDGKVAIITGGVSGIGLASVEAFVEEGACVVVGDIQDALGKALEGRFSGKVLYQHCDVSEEAAIEALVQSAVREFGKLNVMFNNAGAGGDASPMVNLSGKGLDDTLAMLTRSVFAGHKYASRQFLAQGGGGSIISTASAAGIEGGWHAAAYTIAKHAILGVVRQAVVELGRNGIRSNAICPGVILTPIMTKTFGVSMDKSPRFLDFLAERVGHTQPAGRFGVPRDVAEVALFLASDGSSYVNGAVIPVDGGCTAITMGTFARDVVQAAQEFVAKG